MPTPVLALPCGSKSISSTRFSTAASAVARLIAVVVLPTPPFWLTIARMRAGRGSTSTGETSASGGDGGTCHLFETQNGPRGVRGTRMQHFAHIPYFARFGQFL